MAKYKYILTVIIILCTITTYAQPAQYTPMTASGYQMKRLKVDSTFHLPSFCGVPTLRGSLAKEGALAIDTCGGYLYMWTNSDGWDTINVSGGGTTTDTTSLSNRINLKIDSIRRVSDSVFAWINGVKFFQYTDSVGGGTTPTLQQVTDSGSTTTNAISVNSLNIGGVGSKINLSGVTNNLTIYNEGTSDEILNVTNGATGSLKFGGGAGQYVKINTTDQNVELTAPQSNGTIPVSVNGNFADAAGNITISTSGVAVDTIYRTLGMDSIFFKKNNITYAIKDSVGTGGSSHNGRFGNDTATVVMVKVHNESGTILTNGKVVAFSTSGTQSNEPAVRLANNKHDSTSANTLGFVTGTIAINDTGWVILSGKIEKLNTSAFSNGDIIYLDSINGNWTKTKPQAPYHMVYLGVVVKSNAGNGSIYIKCQNGYELDEIHDVKISSPVNNQVLAYSDTQRLWKNRNIYTIVDTTSTIATKSNVALKLNISDTATMLSSYSTRINGKLNISDTSALQRKSIPSYTFLANNTTATANAQALTFKDTSGTYTNTIAWGTSAPTGATNHSYRWTRIGNVVTLNISLVYGTVSSGNTQVTIALPTGAPIPVQPAGTNSASAFLYPATCVGGSTLTASTSVATNRGGIRNNSSNNGFEINISWTTAATFIYFQTTVTYYTN